ncbi:hypothetical protein MYAER_3205 [Microcystis aeruginosa NIES-2549]|uniref:Uncharacterized protein n=1 Tax=Microcystis aeruginosa NIES-2549 TaxID=1641812 RepID=A0A0F6RMT1_MICAE|nr:hypothetical protein MYAER_3205 [Microcystis aeruginosa NIES-2549]AOC53957.1 hypothetical protein amyaer_3252 [Microcystis aeruginosa NIES-2481]
MSFGNIFISKTKVTDDPVVDALKITLSHVPKCSGADGQSAVL